MPRDYLLDFWTPPNTSSASKIGKNDDKTSEKPEKKEKKTKGMSDSRIRKWKKLFGQQIANDENLLNYYSCALVADILLQGYLYISDNYFSFYSNVFGFITKLVIPIEKVEQITREKTARFFPNAIAVHLADSRHVFGSFLSREAAYCLMSTIHKKVTTKSESANDADIESTKETLAISETATNDVEGEFSSLEESSSISGSEGPLQLPIAIATNEEEARAAQEEAESTLNKSSLEVQPLEPLMNSSLIVSTVENNSSENSSPLQSQNEPVARIGSYNVTLMNEFNILYFGICLAILLAIFSGILFFKINAIEKRQTIISNPITFEEAESILQRNLILVKTVRSRLEELHDLLDNSIKSMPKFRSEL